MEDLLTVVVSSAAGVIVAALLISLILGPLLEALYHWVFHIKAPLKWYVQKFLMRCMGYTFREGQYHKPGLTLPIDDCIEPITRLFVLSCLTPIVVLGALSLWKWTLGLTAVVGTLYLARYIIGIDKALDKHKKDSL